jgi:hypothetical protein
VISESGIEGLFSVTQPLGHQAGSFLAGRPLAINSAESSSGLDIQNAGAELKLRAERKGGKLCLELEIEREPGKRTDLTLGHFVTRLQQTAEEAEVDTKTIYRWQLEAKVPDDDFEKHVKDTKTKHKELTSARVLRRSQFIMTDRRVPIS